MQYSAVALLALAGAASAAVTNGTVAYTTEVHTAYTTVCPASTQLTFNGVTYTATAVSILQSRFESLTRGAKSWASHVAFTLNTIARYFRNGTNSASRAPP